MRLSSDLKIPAFITGLVLVSLGTSLPELSAGIAAVMRGQAELAIAIAIGSTIVNLLLVAGISVVAAGGLAIRKKTVDLDIPLFAANMVLFFSMAADGTINPLEGLLLFSAFLIYTLYVLGESGKRELTCEDLITPDLLDSAQNTKLTEIVPTRLEKSRAAGKTGREGFGLRTFFFLIAGITGLIVGAKFVIDSLVAIADALKISGTLVAMTILAAGSALPEIFIALNVVKKKTYDLALGNVLGSSMANLLVVSGVCAMISPLIFNAEIFNTGLPFLLASAVLFVISGISRRINFWEGVMYLFVYFVFIVKLFGIF